MSKNLYYEDELIEQSFNVSMLKRMVAYASKYKRLYLRVVILMLLTSILSLLPTALNKIIIDDVIPQNGVLQEGYIRIATIVVMIWFSLSIGEVMANYFSQYISNQLGNKVIKDLRDDLFAKLTKLGFDYYDSRPAGKILVRVTNYTDEIANFFINDMTRILINLFMMIVSVIIVFVIEARLALVVVLVSIPLGLLIWFMSSKLYQKVRIDRNKKSNRTAFVAENISGLEVIKAFNREELNEQIHETLSEQYVSAFMKTTHYREAFFPLTHGVVRIICTIVIYCTALFLIQKGIGDSLTVGSLVLVSTYMQMFSDNVNTICQRLQNITNITSNIERVFDILDTEEAIKEKEHAVTAFERQEEKSYVTFEHVDFGYQPEMLVLKDVDLTVSKGEMIALVGPTGAGKTTLVSLLCRFYDVNSGSIKINGVDVRDLSFDLLRKTVGIMMQDTYLFTGSILDNIRFAKPEASDDECIEAAKKAMAHNFIMKLKDGYETQISSYGTELSGGEKQLISFARIMLADPEIIILDEATSNIDSETEMLLQNMFREVLKGRTSFVIAHRLSTIKNADRILYIDQEQILEQGNHEELIQNHDYYYRMVQKG